MNRSDSVLIAIPVDGKLNPLPADPVQCLDFDYVEDSLVELVYDPYEAEPYRIMAGGELEESHTDRQSAQVAFEDLVSELVSANKEAEYRRRDYYAGR